MISSPVSRWSCGATCCWRRGPVTSPGDASETQTEGAALPAVWCEPARLGEERRRELAGHAGGPESGAATLATVGTGRHDSPTTEVGQERSHKSYRPLTVLTFRLNYFFSELNPAPYHLANCVLHWLVCLLYLATCYRLVPTHAARFAAALFAVHPIHTEAVSQCNVKARA
uniref:Uncharacterized protein n=1 Tax=Eptatretus burgeri TaxID=7764 RepID=A0A8C4Q937_EPTBU